MAGNPLNTIVRKVQELSSCFNAIDFQFVQREGNLVVDYFAKTCNSSEFHVHILSSQSTFVKQLLLDDNSAIVYV